MISRAGRDLTTRTTRSSLRYGSASIFTPVARLLLRLGEDPAVVEATPRPRSSRPVHRARRVSSPPAGRRRIRRLARPWVPSALAVAFFALGLVFGYALLAAAAPERAPAAARR